MVISDRHTTLLLHSLHAILQLASALVSPLDFGLPQLGFNMAATTSVRGGRATRKSPKAAVARPETDSEFVSRVRSDLGVPRKLFARMTGFSERSIAGWEAGRELSAPSRQRLIEMQRLQQSLAQLMESDKIAKWLETPNPELRNFKPVEVIERGEIDRIWILLYQLDAGIPD